MYPVLTTKRTILRSFQEDDVENVFELIYAFKQQNDGNHFKDIHTLDDAKRLNSETIKNDNEFIIIDNLTLKPIGWILCGWVQG